MQIPALKMRVRRDGPVTHRDLRKHPMSVAVDKTLKALTAAPPSATTLTIPMTSVRPGNQGVPQTTLEAQPCRKSPNTRRQTTTASCYSIRDAAACGASSSSTSAERSADVRRDLPTQGHAGVCTSVRTPPHLARGQTPDWAGLHGYTRMPTVATSLLQSLAPGSMVEFVLGQLFAQFGGFEAA
jgi:hypothetical protein